MCCKKKRKKGTVKTCQGSYRVKVIGRVGWRYRLQALGLCPPLIFVMEGSKVDWD